MSAYVIGDVHGCFDQFIRLVKKIDYDSKKDQIILTGDLVNRGPKSLDVLNYCMADKNITTVLGNHDLYLLYLISINQGKGKLKKIVEAENNKQIFEWLITRPLLIQAFNQSTNNKFIITHAGIPEIWSLEKAQDLADEVSQALTNHPSMVLKAMWGDDPKSWRESLTGNERYRIIINYLTRMRFLSNAACLDLKNTSAKASKGSKPWFHYESASYKKMKQYYVFGHWASLNGQTNNPHFIGLDTGCVWKGKLTALRMDDLEKISVKY
ncbi:symmetrical bis(5'-nucleosyl)-tetraphosphatase [Gammaproteobacteria bacterium]|nr:symmetrical bis(5'-nucleosyl)-tetraphosphatase [Gammaproteobacteria bacterium]MDC3228075.1 symmetrical bis(5'-nucleosyl)-tetraphosphatase [Gammaproteobacteria bacterium]